MSNSVPHDPGPVAHAGFEPAGAREGVSQVVQDEAANSRCKPVVPDHELLRVIGRGAYGEVWLGRNILGEYRAAKVVWRQNFAGEDRPFEREFEGIRRFEPVSRSHPSQLAILHVGKNEELGYFYYVMELADDETAECGARQVELNHVASAASQQRSPLNPDSYIPKTLRRVLRERGALPAQECLGISLALSGALAHLHAQGLVHRDIKPSNVVFVGGVPKLADIGLVAAVDDTLSFVGTAGYIPPEGPGSQPADVFSLGKVLYEALTGRDRQEFPALPQEFASSARDSGLKAQEEGLVGMTERMLIAELNQVVLRACESDCRLRYASAQAMHDELALLATGGSVKRKRSLARRLQLTKNIALGLLLILLAGAGAVLGLHRLNQTRALSRDPKAQKLYDQAVYLKQSETLDRTLLAYASLTEALKRDPHFVEAYLGLFAINWSPWADRLPPHSNMLANFRWVADKIHALRPNSAEYHVVSASIKFHEWRFDEAIDEMQLALRLDPKCRSDGLYGLMLLRARGDAAAARAEWEMAERISGSDVVTQTQLGTPYYVERNFPKAIAELEKAVNLEDRSYVAHDLLARAYEGDKQYDKALDQMEAAEKLTNGDATQIERKYKTYRSALKGPQGAQGMWLAMLDDAKQIRFPDHSYMASLHARLHQFGPALDLLEEARKDHDGSMTMLLIDHWWDPMRDDPQFQALLARVGYSRSVQRSKITLPEPRTSK